MNAEDYIIQTFKDCNIIGLGEGGHHLENAHEFFEKLFSNRKFQEIIDVIILEFANSTYQGILDQYICGKNVDIKDLRKLWRESSQCAGLFGEAPIYFNLLKKIREINFSLPPDKKIRVLGGDPPINWQTINNPEDWINQIGHSRETFPAELAVEYGINQNKKVLIIYSEFHLTKVPDSQTQPYAATITYIINKQQQGAMKVIGIAYSKTLLSQKQFTHLSLYTAIDLFNNDLGNVDASLFFEASLFKDNKEMVLFDGYTNKQLFDAFIYVGTFDSLKRYPMPTTIDFDESSLKELNRRRRIFGRK